MRRVWKSEASRRALGASVAIVVVLSLVAVIRSVPVVAAVTKLSGHSTTITNELGRPARVALCGFGVDAVDLDQGSRVSVDLMPWESACAVYSGDDAGEYEGCLRVGDRDSVVISEASLRRDTELNHC